MANPGHFLKRVKRVKPEDAAVAQRAVELVEYVLAERKAEIAHSIVGLGLREGNIDELAYALDRATTDRRIAIDAYLKGQSPTEAILASRNAAKAYKEELRREWARGLH